MTELKIVFFDKNFKYTFIDEFDKKRIDSLKKLNKIVFEKVFDQYRVNGIMAILSRFPKGWKSYSDYANAVKKFIDEWDKRFNIELHMYIYGEFSTQTFRGSKYHLMFARSWLKPIQYLRAILRKI